MTATEHSIAETGQEAEFTRQLAALLSGLQVPLSLGVLGTAHDPLCWMRDYFDLFGYPDVDATEQHIADKFAEITKAGAR